MMILKHPLPNGQLELEQDRIQIFDTAHQVKRVEIIASSTFIFFGALSCFTTIYKGAGFPISFMMIVGIGLLFNSFRFTRESSINLKEVTEIKYVTRFGKHYWIDIYIGKKIRRVMSTERLSEFLKDKLPQVDKTIV